MPQAEAGVYAAMRLGPRGSEGTGSSRLGARRGCNGNMSKIVCHGAEYSLD